VRKGTDHSGISGSAHKTEDALMALTTHNRHEARPQSIRMNTGRTQSLWSEETCRLEPRLEAFG
jgi:hypothetical protein